MQRIFGVAPFKASARIRSSLMLEHLQQRLFDLSLNLLQLEHKLKSCRFASARLLIFSLSI